MMTTAQQSIARQRDALGIFLQMPLTQLATVCARVWPDRGALEVALRAGLETLPYCDHLFIMNLQGVQITAQIGAGGDDTRYIGLDRSQRPYMKDVLTTSDFVLTEAYISEHKKRSSITAMLKVKQEGIPAGYLSAHFDLRTASLNVYNGLVGLTFSCDGSHSIFADEFLDKGLEFWVGRAAAGITTVPGAS